MRIKEFIFILIAVVLGALIRLHLLSAADFVIDADEAIVGLMAKHILEGKGVPTFYYGQHYMGSLEALCAAVSFSIFGINSFALKLVPFLFSLILIPIFYYLLKLVGGERTARIGTLLLALPPVALVEWSTKARGGFIEILVFGALALLLTIQWMQSATKKLTTVFWIGILLGIGWWVNNQIIYFMVSISCAFLCVVGLQCWKAGVVGTIGFFIGGLPYWLYNIENNFISLQMFSGVENGKRGEQLQGLFASALPSLFGAKRFWHLEELFPNSIFYAYLFWALLLSVYFLTLKRSNKCERGIFFILFFSTCLIFSMSSFGHLVQAPRYLLPAYLGLFAIAALAIDAWFIYMKSIGALFFIMAIGFNLASTYLGGIAVPGEPIVYLGERVSRDHSDLLRWLERNNIKYVRTNYWIGYRLAFETQERVKFKIFHEPMQVRIPEYEKEVMKQATSTIAILVTPLQAPLVRSGLKSLGYSYQMDQVSGYFIFFNIKEPDFQSLKTIPSNQFDVQSSVSTDKAKLMVDGDLETRWGSGEPQKPGMEISVSFNKPRIVSGFEMLLGKWMTDYPRGLRVDIADSEGSWRTIYTPEMFKGIEYVYDDNHRLIAPLPSVPISKIKFTQSGTDAVFDWSLAELKLFQ